MSCDKNQPRVYIERGSAHPPTSENLVEFHLLYEGPQHSEGSDNVRNEKHAIRKIFHRQLRRLWFTQQNLCNLARSRGGPEYVKLYYEKHGDTAPAPPPIPIDEQVRFGVEFMSRNWNKCGFNFLPLIYSELCVRCSLEVLFLRMDERDWVLQGGDVDRRIHVLFDGMRMPRQCSELPTAQSSPDADENPFFCLLEDDTLISDVKIDTGRLLLLPLAKNADQHDVYLQITVKLNPTRSMGESYWYF